MTAVKKTSEIELFVVPNAVVELHFKIFHKTDFLNEKYSFVCFKQFKIFNSYTLYLTQNWIIYNYLPTSGHKRQ